MKKFITTLLLAAMLACTFTGCGEKDYTFTQEEWDTNDLSFIETTPDPNQAYKFIGYFAKRYEDYYVQYDLAGENGAKRDRIIVSVPSINRYLSFEYYIIDNEYGAKNFFITSTKYISDDMKADYGDESYVVRDEEGIPLRYIIKEGNCIFQLRMFGSDSPGLMETIEDFLDYMY